MKNIILPMIIFGFLLSCQEKSNDKLIRADEFEYDGLPDPDKWTYDVGDHGWGNNELQYYTKEKPGNARVENGRLIIEAHKDSSFTKGFEEWPFDHPFYLILNIAVGGDWGGTKGVDPDIWPQRMEVEYIRVYSEKPATGN